MIDGTGPVDNALRSYDVFDTVLTRLVGLPTSVFLLVGHSLVARGYWPTTCEDFLAARISAESRARAHAGTREVTLADIYREIRQAHELSDEIIAKLMDEELSFEERLLRPVPTMLARLKDEHAAGLRHAFISDMYLPARRIREWLEKFGVCRVEDGLWVSSESGATKANGDLFEAVAQVALPSPGSWTHVGDNHWADHSVPTKRGIKAELFTTCHLTDLELTMERFRSESGALSSLLAGASRWTRLTFAGDDKSRSALNDYAAQIAGPVLYAFLLWILRRAQRLGVRRIWFMAEHGQVMLPMMETIARRLQVDCHVGCLLADQSPGLLGEEHCFIVDLGWNGSNAQSLDELIGRERSSRHSYLYFGLYSRPPSCAGLDMAGYLFDIDQGRSSGVGQDIAELPLLMRVFTQADHANRAWDVPLFRERMRAFADSVAIEFCFRPDADLRDLACSLLQKGITAPSIEQARLIAHAYSWRDVWGAFRHGEWPRLGPDCWVAGARVLTPTVTRFLIRCAAKLGRLSSI